MPSINFRLKLLAAVGAALAVVCSARAASAADLGYRDGPPDDDPRYSDIYRHPAPPPPVYAQPGYHPPRHPLPYPPAPVYRDEPRYAPPPPYAGPPPRHYGQAPSGCLPREVARARLEARGWHEFHDIQIAGNVAHVRARRPNGRLFDLTIDRCTGEVLGAELIDGRRADAPPYDWRHYDRRYQY